MRIRDSATSYGLVSILLHWAMAGLILGLFGLGLWMVELDYFHPWYNRAPDLHKVLGVATGILLLLRLTWRGLNTRPHPLGLPWERIVAGGVHFLLYLLTAALVASGYLIVTADGHPLLLSGWLELPALRDWGKGMEDTFGAIHQWLAWTILVLCALHLAAALRHHFIERDATLRRMLWPLP